MILVSIITIGLAGHEDVYACVLGVFKIESAVTYMQLVITTKRLLSLKVLTLGPCFITS